MNSTFSQRELTDTVLHLKNEYVIDGQPIRMARISDQNDLFIELGCPTATAGSDQNKVRVFCRLE